MPGTYIFSAFVVLWESTRSRAQQVCGRIIGAEVRASGRTRHLIAVAGNRLTLFFGYLGTANPRTRFLVYSRRRFAEKDVAVAWVENVVARFPQLKGRVFTMSMPGGRASATFRDPATVRMLRTQVKGFLALP